MLLQYFEDGVPFSTLLLLMHHVSAKSCTKTLSPLLPASVDAVDNSAAAEVDNIVQSNVSAPSGYCWCWEAWRFMLCEVR